MNEALTDIGAEFEAIYSTIGRPSIAPEKLLRALLLQLFHGIRSERQMMERLDFDLSFRWFVGLGIDDPVWDPSTFSKNRERLLDGEIAACFLAAILERPRVKRLLSTDYFFFFGQVASRPHAEQDPSRRGFQHSFAMLQASHNPFGRMVSTDPKKGFVYREDGRTLTSLPDDFYSSDFFATKLIEQLAQSRKEAGGQLFFAYLAFTAPHWPMQAPAETIAAYKGRYVEGYEALRARRLAEQERLGLLATGTVPHPFEAPGWGSLSPDQKARSSRSMEVYAAMVDRIDQNVGRVIAALSESGELKNTVILFMSDNGADGMRLENQTASPGAKARYEAADNRLENIGAATSYSSIGPGWAKAVTGPSWSYKGAQTEGGTRVVAFLAGPGIKSGFSADFLSAMDVLPTFLDLAHVPAPCGCFMGRTIQPIRGLSWAPWLNGTSQRVYDPYKPVGAELLGERAVRRGVWKLLDRGDRRWRLFSIADDPGETKDLASRYPDRTKALAAEWDRYAGKVDVVLPQYDTPPTPHADG